MAEKLSSREARFVHAVIAANGNHTKAALAIGCTPQSAARIGYRLSSRVHVREAIEQAQGRLTQQAGFTAEKVIEELAVVAQSTPKAYSGGDKLKALELLGKANGLFHDKRQDGRIVVNIGFLTPAHASEPTTIDLQVMPSRLQDPESNE